jgi:Fungal N-terminal domain of STAND proteins
MDPLSITASALGILGTVTALSMTINTFRKDFTEARTEIDRVTGDLNELSMILSRLGSAREIDALPDNLSKDLGGVLKNCKQTVVELEVHLEKSSKKTFRGATWAFSGKKDCLELCRRMESHKLTINTALTMATA